MRVYVLCDLEGTAGVGDQIHQCSFIHDSYADQADCSAGQTTL